MAIDDLVQRRIHLVGLVGLEVADVACFLARRGARHMVAHDLAGPEDLYERFRAAHIGMSKAARQVYWEALSGLGLPLRSGDDYLAQLEDAEVVIASQAWRLYEANAPLARALESGAVRLVTPIEVYLRLAAERGIPSIGVTGSNGKSTTVNLIAHLVREGGVPCVLAGNYRYRGPILERLDRLPASGRLVLEISNHHLLALRQPVAVAVITNVTPNHLSEHGGFAAYVDVKRQILTCQRATGVAVLNADDPVSRELAESARGEVRWFSLARADAAAGLAGDWLVLREPGGREQRLLRAGELPLPGRHNCQNALAAALAVASSGLPTASLGPALKGFAMRLPGRLELVREVGGVQLVYDIESTTPESTQRALETFADGCVHLVAGGDDKGLDYGPLAESVARHGARLLLLPGTASGAMAEAAEARGVRVRERDTLEAAVRCAWAESRPGEVILVSPGARGFYNRHISGKTSFARIAKRLRVADRGGHGQ